MRKFVIVVLLGGFIAFNLGAQSSYASEVDVLLKKLVDKGILSASEAQEIKTETNEEIARTEKQKTEDYKQLSKDTLPDWVKNTRPKGDLRVRYEWDKDKAQHDNSRARIRARVGLESKVNQKLKMAVGIATGSTSDPRSRNITLGSDATQTNTPGSAKSIVLDYAYGQYTPLNGLSILAGKIQNPLWQPHDVIWKTDITPDGAGLILTRKLNSKIDIFMNDLIFFMKNDTRTDKQTILTAYQPGVNIGLNDKTNLKSAFTYNRFFGFKNANTFTASGTRTNTIIGGRYAYNYDSIQPSAELSFKEPFYGLLPYASIFGDYIYNVAMRSTDITDATGRGGFDVGVKFGTENISDWGQWRTKFIYSKLGRDCWPDIFTDSDRFGGKTNSQAWEAILDYGLGKNTWMSIDYYYARSLAQSVTTGRAPEHVLQLDWNMKF